MSARMPRLGIITLQRKPPDALNWMRYHVDVGVHNFYIWLEDSDDLETVLKTHAAKLQKEKKTPIKVYVEIGKVDRKKEDNYTDLMTRQQSFVNNMITRARADGVDWVFHIDDDELLHPRSHNDWRAVLGEVTPECSSVHITNWEGFSPEQPQSSWITDSGVRYMTSQCKHLYAAYTNGKSASKTTMGQAANGPHHFRGGKECELNEEAGVVLHHDSLALGPDDLPPKIWHEKNVLRAHSDMSKVPFEAAKESVTAVLSGDKQLQQQVWEKYRSQRGARFAACPFTSQEQLPSHSYGSR